MERDLIYVFDKLTFIGTQLGEIQSDFNMSFVIDGTKDSFSCVVWSFQESEIEPYTIIYHPKTETWWIVSHDKVERYMNDSGFYYVHNLELLGAIELLNARDLTDCGFNDNTYTVQDFILRLFKLSNFEYNYNAEYFFQANDNFLNKNVDFIKTFENYTLLSALREFLDAYNMSAKMSFSSTYYSNTDTYLIDYPMLYIIPKTGDYNLTLHGIDEFDDVRETKTMDKNSFGTCVVSNAENVISSKEKTYPSTGSVKLTSTQFNITDDNAVLRLPSKVFRGISLTAHIPLDFEDFGDPDRNIRVFPDNYKSVDNFVNAFLTYVQDHTTASQYAAFLTDFNRKKEQAIENMKKASHVTFYDGNNIDPTYDNGKGRIIKGANVPYLASLFDRNELPAERRSVIFTDKASKEMLPKPYQGIAWDRGSDLITGFEGLDNFVVTSLMATDYQTENNIFYSYSVSNQTFKWELARPEQQQTAPIYQPMGVGTTTWSVVYIPMSDIKIKVDNQRDKRDIQLYNQNGRITDGVALSKLLNSYSKEISSDNIVRYMQFTNYNDIPKVGSCVIKNKDIYVINNVSLTFTQNETSLLGGFGYYIDCEFNMSKMVSMKSLLVNPNSNIRDYGIPQSYNVKRKQLYRDYYEMSFGRYDDADTDYYLSPLAMFGFGHSPNGITDNFIAIIKIGYDEQVEGKYYWFYQLETTNYYMSKMFYAMLDFKDNNIIGYGSQNVFSGFDITKVLNPASYIQTLNTPISYVDANGKLKSLNVLLCSNEQLTTIYQKYREDNPVQDDDGDIDLYNYSVFIPSDIFENAYNENEYSIQIDEQNYKKDALEVPVFEYVCQIGDSIDVLIGDNILTQYNGFIYFYSYVEGENLNQNNVSPSNHVIAVSQPIGWRINNSCRFGYRTNPQGHIQIAFGLFGFAEYVLNTNSWIHSGSTNVNNGKDYAIFRHAYNIATGEEKVDLMLIAKKVPSGNIEDNIVYMDLNHYKLN